MSTKFLQRCVNVIWRIYTGEPSVAQRVKNFKKGQAFAELKEQYIIRDIIEMHDLGMSWREIALERRTTVRSLRARVARSGMYSDIELGEENE